MEPIRIYVQLDKHLLSSSYMEKIDLVKLLLKNDANPNITNEDGLTPFHIAVLKQNITIVKILLKYGSNPNLKSK